MWDLIIKGVTAFVAVATVAISAGVYLSQRDLEIKVFDRQSKEIFLKKQSEVYFEVVSIVSRFASQVPCKWKEEDLAKFWELYWGELAMVSDIRVSRVVIDIGHTLKESGFTNEVPTSCDTGVSQSLLRASINLANCVRTSMEISWGVELGDPKDFIGGSCV